MRSVGYGGVVWFGGVAQVALDCGLNVIACVGESLEIREANKTLEVGAELLTAGIRYILKIVYNYSTDACIVDGTAEEYGTYALGSGS